MKKKLAIMFMSFFYTFSINTNAVQLNNDDMDYIKQKETLNKSHELNNIKLKKIDSEKEYSKKILDNLIMDFNKNNFNKKYKATINKVIINKNNENLIMWEVLLNSNSFTDMMNNLSLIQSKKNMQDKKLIELNSKKNQSIKKYLAVNEDILNLDEEKKTLINENKNIIAKKNEIEKEVSKIGNVFFNEKNILQKSNISLYQSYKILKGTNLHDLAPVYIEAEKIYGINALFLMGLTAEESGWGTSKRAINDNNLTGLGAYSRSAKGNNSNTKRDNILKTASILKNNYLTSGGPYFNGYAIQNINKNYCMSSNGGPDYNWSIKITKIAKDLLTKTK